MGLFHRSPLLIAALLATMLSDGAAQAEDVKSGAVSLYLKQLLGHPEAVIGSEPAACMSGENPPRVQSELTAILTEFGDGKGKFAIAANCETADESDEFCRLALSVSDGEEQASAGFTFLAARSDHAIKLESLQCFQTP